MKKQRVITVTVDIDMETHEAALYLDVVEDGKKKTRFSLSEAVSTVSALEWAVSGMLENMRGRILEFDQEFLKFNTEEEK